MTSGSSIIISIYTNGIRKLVLETAWIFQEFKGITKNISQ
jgi:hypothetical protein